MPLIDKKYHIVFILFNTMSDLYLFYYNTAIIIRLHSDQTLEINFVTIDTKTSILFVIHQLYL